VGAAVWVLTLTAGRVAASCANTLALCKLQIKPATAKAVGVRRVVKEKQSVEQWVAFAMADNNQQ
jgi:hypothetical protein